MVSRDQATRPLPHPTPLTQPFWDATREGRLIVQRCSTCRAWVWTPQMACRDCLTETLEWEPVAGKGHVYTYVVIHQAAIAAFKAPYVIAVVELDEGPRLFTDLVQVEPASVCIDLPVELAWEFVDEVGLYHFRPVDPALRTDGDGG